MAPTNAEGHELIKPSDSEEFGLEDAFLNGFLTTFGSLTATGYDRYLTTDRAAVPLLSYHLYSHPPFTLSRRNPSAI
jgi:hypothetical protein